MYNSDLDSLDLFTEVLSIIYKWPGLTLDTIFDKTTLAMDKISCLAVLNNLVDQELVSSFDGEYSITELGIRTIIPETKTIEFPSFVTKTHVDYVKEAEVVPATILLINYGDRYTLTKQGVSLEITPNEMRQIWKKLHRDYGSK